MDYNGKSELSDVIRINRSVKQNVREEVSLFPNPAASGEPVHIIFRNLAEASLSVYNVSGNIVQSLIVSPDDGSGYVLPTSGLRPGIYLIRISGADHASELMRFVIR